LSFFFLILKSKKVFTSKIRDMESYENSNNWRLELMQSNNIEAFSKVTLKSNTHIITAET
jgi:hypothetical protein